MKRLFTFIAIALLPGCQPAVAQVLPVYADHDSGAIIEPENFWSANAADIVDAIAGSVLTPDDVGVTVAPHVVRKYPMFEIPVPWNSGFTDFELKGSTSNFLNFPSGSVLVSGAGSAGIDGVYSPDGTMNGRPFYTDGGGLNFIYWLEGSWVIESIAVGGEGYISSTDVATPDLVNTWTVLYGASPAPTVTAAGTQLTYYFHSPAPIGQPGAPGGQVYSNEPVVYFTDSGYSDPRRNRASNNEDSIADQLTDVNSEVGSITVILIPGESDDWLSASDPRLTWTYHLMDGSARDEDPANRSIWRTIQPVRWLTEAEFQAQSKLPQ